MLDHSLYLCTYQSIDSTPQPRETHYQASMLPPRVEILTANTGPVAADPWLDTTRLTFQSPSISWSAGFQTPTDVILNVSSQPLPTLPN
jgi:hypothetical protein